MIFLANTFALKVLYLTTTYCFFVLKYYLVGVLCGLAVYNSVILDVHFPHAIYRKLLGLPLGLEDVIDKDTRKGLKSLLEYEGDDVVDVFCLNLISQILQRSLFLLRLREINNGSSLLIIRVGGRLGRRGADGQSRLQGARRGRGHAAPAGPVTPAPVRDPGRPESRAAPAWAHGSDRLQSPPMQRYLLLPPPARRGLGPRSPLLGCCHDRAPQQRCVCHDQSPPDRHFWGGHRALG